MARRLGSFPHPVVGNSDDVDALFEVTDPVVTPTVDSLEVTFRVRLTDDDLKAMITEGDAKYHFRWSCANTLSSGDMGADVKVRHADGATFVSYLDQRSVLGNVDVDIRVVAAKKLDSYQLANQHPDYAGATFSVEAGDTLAESPGFHFEAQKLYSPEDAPVGSCFRLQRDPKVRKGMEVSWQDPDHVLISLGEEEFSQAHRLQSQPNAIIGLLILPALTETIWHIQRAAGDEDLADSDWYRTIESLAADQKSDLFEGSPLMTAQLILSHPLSKALADCLPTEMDDDD